MAKTVYGMNPRTCEYLESLGIDPHRIPLDGWDATGYDSVPGRPPMGDGRLPRERHQWPAGFDYAKLLALWAEDEPTRRRSGVGGSGDDEPMPEDDDRLPAGAGI